MPRLEGGPERLAGKRWLPNQLDSMGACLLFPVEGKVHVYRYRGENDPAIYGGVLVTEETYNPEKPKPWHKRKLVIELWIVWAHTAAVVALMLGILARTLR